MKELSDTDFTILGGLRSEDGMPASDIPSLEDPDDDGPPDLEDTDDDTLSLEDSNDSMPALEDSNDLTLLESGSPEWCNESVFNACVQQDRYCLAVLLYDYGHLVKANYNNWAAWKECVRYHQRDLCELLIKHFGTRIIYDSWSIREACMENEYDASLFLLNLLKDEPFTDCVALEAASRKGYIGFVNQVLDNWKCNDEVDVLSLYFAVVSGSIDGDQEELFDSVLARFRAIDSSVFNPAHSNRSLLVITAKKQDYKYFQKAINTLDYAWSKPHDCYMSLGTTSIRETRHNVKRELIDLCSQTKDPRFTNDLVESIGASDLATRLRQETAELACRNGHTAIAELFALKGDLQSVLSLFITAGQEKKYDVCRVFLAKLGTRLVTEIESEGLTWLPAVKDLLKEYFLGLAIKYGHDGSANTKPIRPWFHHPSMSACGLGLKRGPSQKSTYGLKLPNADIPYHGPSQIGTCGLKPRSWILAESSKVLHRPCPPLQPVSMNATPSRYGPIMEGGYEVWIESPEGSKVGISER